MATAHAADLTLTPTLASGDTGAWLDDYEEFLLALCTDDNTTERTFQMEAIRAALRLIKPGRYASINDLVAETWADADRTVLKGYYGTEAEHRQLCTFPDKLAASLDLATAAGKSYVIYGLLRIALNEGWFRRAVVLCPSLTIEAADRELSRRAEDLSGVYVYSFLHYLQYPNDPDTGRCWLKVGSTAKGAWKRVLEQTRQTSMPEDPKLLRIYRSATLTPAEIEARFHAVLDAAGHERSATTHTKAGKEWFSTTVELLDTLAEAIGLDIETLEVTD